MEISQQLQGLLAFKFTLFYMLNSKHFLLHIEDLEE